MKLNNFEKFFAILIYFLLVGIFIFALIYLLFSVESLKGLIFCLFYLLVFLTPINLFLNKNATKYYFITLTSLFLVVFVGGFQINNKTDGNYSLVDLENSKYNFNLLNNLSEKELLNFGTKLAFVLGIKNESLNSFIGELNNYEKINIALPSQIPNALINKKEQKYVLYSPQNYNKEKLIFVLHGSCGGFLFYQKYFKQFADKYNNQVVTPTFGWGNWNENGGVDLIYNTYNDLLNKQKINKNTQIILIGISNGGVGISRSIYFDDKNIFQKIIYISGVMEENIINTPNFEKNIKNKEVYVISGEKDDRVFYDNYLKQKDKLNVKKDLVFADGDHFILLSKGQKIIDFIDKIIKQ